MADPLSSHPDSFSLDGLQGRPTFVQIRAPAPVGTVRRKLGVGIVGLALVAALGWAAYRLPVEQAAPTVTQVAATMPEPAPTAAEVAPTVTETLSPQEAPVDLYPELAMLATDAAVSSPAWGRASLMNWLPPFDPSAPDREAPSGAQQADAPDTTRTALYEVSVRLEKGDTVGSALHERGFAAEAVAGAVSALARHVSLKRLPIGLVMTLRIRPPEEEAAKPILQALTLKPEARREITIARDDEGN